MTATELGTVVVVARGEAGFVVSERFAIVVALVRDVGGVLATLAMVEFVLLGVVEVGEGIDEVGDDVGDEVAIVTGDAEVTPVGPVFVFASTTEFCSKSRIIDPSEVHVTVTVRDAEVADTEGVIVQPVAVPRLRKSPDEMPDTGSEKVSVYVKVRLSDGDAGDVQLALGDVPSAVELLETGRPLKDAPSFPASSWRAALEAPLFEAGAV